MIFKMKRSEDHASAILRLFESFLLEYFEKLEAFVIEPHVTVIKIR